MAPPPTTDNEVTIAADPDYITIPNLKCRLAVFPGEQQYVAEYFKDTIVDNVANFVPRPDDIWIAGYRKSGTNWMQEIVYMLATDCSIEKATAANLNQRTHFLDKKHWREIEAWQEAPRIMKTNLNCDLLPAKVANEAKIIYVVRNPKDQIISNYHYCRLLTMDDYQGEPADFLGLWLDGLVSGGPWWKHVHSYTKRLGVNVHLVHYEQLLQNPHQTIRGIAEFMGVGELDDDKVNLVINWCSFDNMKKNPMTNKEWHRAMGEYKEGLGFFRKGKVGDWKNYENIFDEVTKAKFNLKFEQFIAEKLKDVPLYYE